VAKENLDLLRSQSAFADAFLVRLEDGTRNIASSDSGSTRNSPPSNASEIDPEEAEEVEAAVSIKTQSDDRRRDPEVPLQVDRESVNTTAESPEEHAAPTLWHVVIATYNGKVPSNEVAAFLINSAKWGVRSVELFGQTTYSSRSFVDLKDAQEMLTNIQSEGFDQARIEALY
jgi:hypothetical protein